MQIEILILLEGLDENKNIILIYFFNKYLVVKMTGFFFKFLTRQRIKIYRSWNMRKYLVRSALIPSFYFKYLNVSAWFILNYSKFDNNASVSIQCVLWFYQMMLWHSMIESVGGRTGHRIGSATDHNMSHISHSLVEPNISKEFDTKKKIF